MTRKEGYREVVGETLEQELVLARSSDKEQVGAGL